MPDHQILSIDVTRTVHDNLRELVMPCLTVLIARNRIAFNGRSGCATSQR